jgi:non-homologous end joining protein Ku
MEQLTQYQDHQYLILVEEEVEVMHAVEVHQVQVEDRVEEDQVQVPEVQ